jgi:molybdate transport system substrate-binding protein
MMKPVQSLAALVLLGAALLPARARAGEVSVAVAANFTAPAKQLAAGFQMRTGNTLVLSFGASGTFAAEIVEGAPFEVFLSADQDRPRKLAAAGLAVRGSEFTYAIGKLALYSAKPGFVDAKGSVLSRGNFAHIAIADPKTAPYGAAALQTLNALGLSARLAPKIVRGKDISQTYQFVATGNAELGFIALSQVIHAKGGSQWLVPAGDYRPIRQDAVLLAAGAKDPAATAFLDYLKSPAAQAIIRSYGYATSP